MDYKLRNSDELTKDWNILCGKEKYLKEAYAAELGDIEADKRIIELELNLLRSLGKYHD